MCIMRSVTMPVAIAWHSALGAKHTPRSQSQIVGNPGAAGSLSVGLIIL